MDDLYDKNNENRDPVYRYFGEGFVAGLGSISPSEILQRVMDLLNSPMYGGKMVHAAMVGAEEAYCKSYFGENAITCGDHAFDYYIELCKRSIQLNQRGVCGEYNAGAFAMELNGRIVNFYFKGVQLPDISDHLLKIAAWLYVKASEEYQETTSSLLRSCGGSLEEDKVLRFVQYDPSSEIASLVGSKNLLLAQAQVALGLTIKRCQKKIVNQSLEAETAAEKIQIAETDESPFGPKKPSSKTVEQIQAEIACLCLINANDIRSIQDRKQILITELACRTGWNMDSAEKWFADKFPDWVNAG